ncbi:MAG: hypothetical protein OXE99_08500 [Cellvibrionales bacterium]|nr:hypothetical protein [Cellvibrionales bacterium]
MRKPLLNMVLLTLPCLPLILHAKIKWHPVEALKQAFYHQTDLNALIKLTQSKSTQNLWVIGTANPETIKPLMNSVFFKKIVISEGDDQQFLSIKKDGTLKNTKTSLVNHSPDTFKSAVPFDLVLINHTFDQKLPPERTVPIKASFSNVYKHLKMAGCIAGIINTYDNSMYQEATLYTKSQGVFFEALADFPELPDMITITQIANDLKAVGFSIQTIKQTNQNKTFINDTPFLAYLRNISLEYRWIAKKDALLSEQYIHRLSEIFRELSNSKQQSVSIQENQILFVAKKVDAIKGTAKNSFWLLSKK